MDVLRPTLININGRIYRKNVIKEHVYQEEDGDEFSYTGTDSAQCADEPCDMVSVEETEKGFRCAMDMPSVLYKYIIGKKGETRKRLETETKTSIAIPKPGVEGKIVITGQQRSAVTSAVTRIELLVESFRAKQPFTHFLSFALNHALIQEHVLKFKEDVLEHCSQDRGVDDSIFQNPAKLHLTVGTLTLLSDGEVDRARQLLLQCQDLIRDIAGGKPISLMVGGIEYMNDDPAMVDVLYAKVQPKDGSDRLQVIADRLVEHFVSAGMMAKQWDRVKLHATVMNTLFRKDSSAEDKGNAGRPNVKDRESFDARNILRMFGSYGFGEFDLNAVQISQRYSTDSSGFYMSAGSVTFS
ncbi:activating signal cointegrator 1 complex subunit 1 [Brienomyrus brachyistius]|uniref:activating signal cointegrator 1 complex subunit 1 n=1 Tax=Brienomyrus brachyistius TaxID=42636 RepID=UPI0020B2AA26|nr:activating signal cointegrator 1 complex subunit 1 [Brienomyrus brachyistius]